MNKTLQFYDQNAEAFVANTRKVDFSAVQDKFLDKVCKNGRILDFGCGSGRDSRYFLEHGYTVKAIDGSKELCQLASEYIGQPVQQMMFQEFDEVDAYDAIWACASILHLSMTELVDVLQRLGRGLHKQGILYMSFKYGKFEGVRNGRFFTFLDEEGLSHLLEKIPMLHLEEKWITGDVREGRECEQWMNLLLRKE